MKIDEEMGGEESIDFDWTTDEEDEIEEPSTLFVRRPGKEVMVANGEASEDYAHHPIASPVQQLGKHQRLQNISSDPSSSDYNENPLDDFLDIDDWIDDETEEPSNSILERHNRLLSMENTRNLSEDEQKLLFLVDMGYTIEEASIAIERCGPNASVEILADFMDAVRIAREEDCYLPEDKPMETPNSISERHTRLLSMAEMGTLSGEEQKLLFLVDMGYTIEEASIAMERCGPNASDEILTDFMDAAQMAREEDCYLPEDMRVRTHSNGNITNKKRKSPAVSNTKNLEDEPIRLPIPMIGFGVPSMQSEHVRRPIPEGVVGPPYFYFENVACAPKGVWDTISRFLYEIEPEFVDSKYFCASARKRGYVHNLPIENRFPLVPLPPMTISQAFQLSRKYWPEWDPREKLNCIQTCIASAKLTKRIRNALERYNDAEPPEDVKKIVLEQCRKWNLIWTGKNKVAPLEPDEMEMLLGFPKHHTRGGGISRTDRVKSLGNAFQVDTVAYHLSVLKDIFPDGVNVLSLFSGIGGAEVALHRLGIKLKNVVTVEKSRVNRDIVRSWWEQTHQTGNLIDFDDVQQVDDEVLEQLISSLGGFDLVIGGSPCNNFTGSNRISRNGLEGDESALFYDFFRIMETVRSFMARASSI